MRKRVQKTPVYGPSENHTSIETIPQQTLTSGDISTSTGLQGLETCVQNVGAGTGYARMNN